MTESGGLRHTSEGARPVKHHRFILATILCIISYHADMFINMMSPKWAFLRKEDPQIIYSDCSLWYAFKKWASVTITTPFTFSFLHQWSIKIKKIKIATKKYPKFKYPKYSVYAYSCENVRNQRFPHNLLPTFNEHWYVLNSLKHFCPEACWNLGLKPK